MDRIANIIEYQGYGIDSILQKYEIINLLNKIISNQKKQREFNKDLASQIWDISDKNQFNKVKIGDYLQNFNKKNYFHYLTPQHYEQIQRQSYTQSLKDQKIQRQSHGLSENSQFKVRAQQYSQHDPSVVFKVQNKQSMSKMLNASIQGSIAYGSGTSLVNENNIRKDQNNKIKKNISNDNQLNQSLLSDMPKNEKNKNKKQKDDKQVVPRPYFIPIIILIVGAIIFTSSFIIHSVLVSTAIDYVVLKPQNQGLWAHFPGDSGVQIDRNWTFFNITNAQQMLFHNQKPRFRQIQGFKIIQLQQYVNITYIQDGDRVQMIDWLHFIQQPDTRSLEQKVKILNVGALAYWYNLKITRPTVILQQGLALLFNNLQDSIIQNIYAQAIKTLYLTNYQTTCASLLSIVGLDAQQSFFLWQDAAYGLKQQDNLKYWIEAVPSQQQLMNQKANEQALYLADYFTLSDSQLSIILNKFSIYIQSIRSIVLQNKYCNTETTNLSQPCTGHNLAYKQIANSFVTKNPPKGTPILPTQTICESNVTCAGYFPQLSAYYQHVYLVRNPMTNKTLKFDWQLTRKWFNYNDSLSKDYDYNTRQNSLLHIGNLDALWDNGTLADQKSQKYGYYEIDQQNNLIPSKYILNIKQRFQLPSFDHAVVFWSWIKYLTHQLILQKQPNQILGVANLFTKGLYQSFSFLQDNLQDFLLTKMIYYETQNNNVGDCIRFLQDSMQLNDQQKTQRICNKYGQRISEEFVEDMLDVCTNKFGSMWKVLNKGYNIKSTYLTSLCDPQSGKNTFGSILHQKRMSLNNLYNCSITPKQYCSNYKLAVIQFISSNITLSPPSQLNLKSSSYSFNSFISQSKKFQYSYYKSKYPNQTFPQINVKQGYKLLNFDKWFSAPVVLKEFSNNSTNKKIKNYMRYVAIQSGLNGLTTERTARELIFGYEDELLLEVKNMYPPFGGDPSTPALVAFNDPNITKQQANLKLQWSTGKYNSSLASQYRKINDLTYLTIPKDLFNGNITKTQLISPWQGEDYFYGTSAKMFSPNQFQNGNISLYVPNIQRYGSGTVESTFDYQRFGFDLKIGYLGEYIYESTSQSDINKKYYQNFHAIFNQTSVVGFPLFVSKNHFMNCSQNWTKLVEIYNEDETIKYVNSSEWDDSFVIVQPYTGVSFQSTIYLQSNYYHLPDQLFNFYQQSLLPVFSLCRSGNVTQQMADKLFAPLKIGINAVKITRIIGIVVMVIVLGYVGVVYYKRKKQVKNKTEQETVNESVLSYSSLGISLQPYKKQQQEKRPEMRKEENNYQSVVVTEE